MNINIMIQIILLFTYEQLIDWLLVQDKNADIYQLKNNSINDLRAEALVQITGGVLNRRTAEQLISRYNELVEKNDIDFDVEAMRLINNKLQGLV